MSTTKKIILAALLASFVLPLVGCSSDPGFAKTPPVDKEKDAQTAKNSSGPAKTQD